MKKYLLFAIGLFSLFVVNTKAELYASESIALSLNSYYVPTYYGVSSNSTTTVTMNLYVEDYNAYNNARFLLLTLCTPHDVDSWGVSNSSKVGSYFDEFFDTYDSGKRCYMGDNTRGTLKFVQFYIGKAKPVDGTAEIRVSSYLHLNNIYSYNVRYDFLQVQLSDEDYLGPLVKESVNSQKQQEMIDKLTQNIQAINGVKDKQDQTNSKLDDLNSKQDQTNSKLDDLNKNQNKTNDKIDDIKDMDIDSDAKEKPDDSDYKNYEKSQGDITDKIDDVPMDNLDIGIDAESSNFIFESMYKFINAHPAVFSMFIAILSIGIIKLGLGR